MEENTIMYGKFICIVTHRFDKERLMFYIEIKVLQQKIVLCIENPVV